MRAPPITWDNAKPPHFGPLSARPFHDCDHRRPRRRRKSCAARRLARRLGFRFLDTGAMYRAVALAGKRAGVDWDQPEELAAVAASLTLELSNDAILMNGEDVTAAIRTLEITTLTQHAADNQAVRRLLTDQQRAFAAGQDVVTEGRDQATVVFPGAECKIFLTAGEEERARRRFLDLQARGEEVDLAEVLRNSASAINAIPSASTAAWPKQATRSKSSPTASTPTR